METKNKHRKFGSYVNLYPQTHTSIPSCQYFLSIKYWKYTGVDQLNETTKNTEQEVTQRS